MPRKKKRKTIVYKNLLEDDFAGTAIKKEEVGADFPYIRDSLAWKICSWLLYYLVAIPIVYGISKLYLGMRFENRKALRGLSSGGYFFYCNHTHLLDVFIIPLAAFPKRVYTVAGADAVSIRGLKRLVMLLGCLPIPTKISALPGYRKVIRRRYEEGSCIAIFPEAHIWPYYTGIRPFGDTSFTYPARLDAPVVAATVTYRRRRGLFRFCRKPGMTVHIGSPIYGEGAGPRERKIILRDQVYAYMCKTVSERENIAYIRYVPAEEAGKNDGADYKSISGKEEHRK